MQDYKTRAASPSYTGISRRQSGTPEDDTATSPLTWLHATYHQLATHHMHAYLFVARSPDQSNTDHSIRSCDPGLSQRTQSTWNAIQLYGRCCRYYRSFKATINQLQSWPQRQERETKKLTLHHLSLSLSLSLFPPPPRLPMHS
jgi:hypothetical protein